ncbi:hypothetical protein [Kribbella solani]|uniref:Uncharacterized protein YxjI n=1 Tax=Kribbella solani TaxID=236067 RepID=A0A841DPE1_9ACTN|nr:hypothetical protein [Kribbella solani]MBB5978815.1 uncharacterized protein YxjI [Kribbella solani]MDX3000465.1 hypothetical protein [Kribbella solani]
MTEQPSPMYVPKFSMKQRITLMANKYELIATNPDGSDGALLAFAQQKRMAFKEQVTFYTDDTKTQPVFSFKARKTIDLGSGYDVYDANGQPIGWFKKEFGKSLLRSSWQLSAAGVEADGTERNATIAIVRRVWEFVPFVGEIPLPFIFHFDFTDRGSGRPVLSVERKVSVRDRYRIDVQDQRLDFRVAAAMTVALDALQSR